MYIAPIWQIEPLRKLSFDGYTQKWSDLVAHPLGLTFMDVREAADLSRQS
jgi:hypothetical protein